MAAYMAGARTSRLGNNFVQKHLEIVKRWQGTAHTLAVEEQIKKKRAESLQGGGQKRIDAQHKKASVFVASQFGHGGLQWSYHRIMPLNAPG